MERGSLNGGQIWLGGRTKRGLKVKVRVKSEFANQFGVCSIG
jgi:hypothetical protein